MGRHFLLFAGLLLVACAGVDDRETNESLVDDCGDGLCDVNRTDGFCSVSVRGRGSYEVENVYLPGVLSCENHGGSPASLRAQAIAARSYLYQILASEGSIADSQADQVFSCGKPPQQKHYDAVAATSGQFLRYRSTTVAAFYVAGSLQSSSSCTGGTRDPTRTERFVTYNSGKSGNSITQSRLGFRSQGNHANRGAMSQNGANCHADRGRSTEDILKFYYGADIEIAQAQGPCIDGPVPDVGDIGAACSRDSQCEERCETTVAGGSVSGICSAACEYGCPENSECVDLGTGEGRCAPRASLDNQFCDYPGFEPAVLQTAKGKWLSVCAPLALETTCSVAGIGGGECMDINVGLCAGTLHEGECPGGNEVQCCTP